MERRQFIRLAGGGAVFAALAPLAGCSRELPAEALSPWNGPGAEPDLRRWLLGHAILAPHSHNLQSWLADLRTPDEITLRVDRSRLLPETDPFSRQIMMSHGTFIELLDLAARERGMRAEISLYPEGEFGPSTRMPSTTSGKRIAQGTVAGAPHSSAFTKLASRPKNRPKGTQQAI